MVLLDRFLIRLDVTLIGENDLLILENLLLVVDDCLFRHFLPAASRGEVDSTKRPDKPRRLQRAYMVTPADHFVNDSLALEGVREFVMSVFA